MRVSKIILLLILLFGLCDLCSAQKHDKEYDEFFILGSLNDYMGRIGDPRLSNQLDIYYSSESPFTDLLDSVLTRRYPSTVYRIERHKIQRNNRISFQVFSDSLNKLFNTYYNFTPTGSKTTEDKTIYYGKLKEGIFKNNKEKLAFLAGCYARFGVTCDTAYCISLANTTSKAAVCEQLLKEFNCTPFYKILHNIPTGNVIYFHPKKIVKNYLVPYKYLPLVMQQEILNILDSRSRNK